MTRNRKEYRRKYYQEHREKALAQTKVWQVAHDYMRQWEQNHKHPCIDCGKLCSRQAGRCKSCAMKSVWADGKMANRDIKADKHPNWQGGHHQFRGYILIHKPQHPEASNSGYIFEHRFIWEQTHGKPVPKGHIIHHLNGIKNDNRPENLIAVSRKKHEGNTFIKALQARIRELEQLRFSI